MLSRCYYRVSCDHLFRVVFESVSVNKNASTGQVEALAFGKSERLKRCCRGQSTNH